MITQLSDATVKSSETELRPQWVELNVEPRYFNYLASKWTCPKNVHNREVLPKDDWETLRKLFIEADDHVNICKEAEIISTYHGNFGKSYLVWLEFVDNTGNKHKIDVYINECGKNSKNAEKHIDPRSPLCQDILRDIFETGHISSSIVKLLPSIGSVVWTGTVETKVQKKLNSFIQARFFEKACDKVGVKYEQLDAFDGYLYRGDPGRLADYDLTFSDGTKVRIDLKLIQSSTKLFEQNPHDAELLISSDWRTAEVKYYRVFGNPAVEATEQFKTLLSTFRDEQAAAGKCFIHINHIDLCTGKVDYIKF